MAGTDVIFSKLSFPHEIHSISKQKKNAGSVKSTKSLYFTDPDASGTMARDEEVTLNIYDIYSDGPSENTEDGGKIKRSEATPSAHPSEKPILTNGIAPNLQDEVANTSTPRSDIKKEGAFRMKAAGDTPGKLSHASSSGSLHDQHFREVLSNTLNRKLASSASSLVSDVSVGKSPARQNSSPGDASRSRSPAAVSTAPSLATTDQVQNSQAVPDRIAISSLPNGGRTGFDGGKGNDISPGDAFVAPDADVIITHKTSKVDVRQSTGNADDQNVYAGQSSGQPTIVDEISRSGQQGSGESSGETMIIQESVSVSHSLTEQSDTTSNSNKARSQSGTKGKFLIRYKEGPQTGHDKKVTDHEEEKADIATKGQQSTHDDAVSVSSTSALKSVVKDENFRDAISGLLAGGRKPDVSTSAPSSLLRPKKLKIHNAEISIDSPSSIEETANDSQFESSTFPRNKDKGVISSTPTSPYDDMKVTVEGGTVGRLVKDIFWNMPLTGRAIDPSTIERKNRTPDLVQTQQSQETRKYNFLVEGIDIPEQPKDDDQTGLATPEVSRSPVERELLRDVSDTGFESGPASPSIADVTDRTAQANGILENVESVTAAKSDGAGMDYTEEVLSLKKLGKKGFSYINPKLAEAVVKKAGDFTARRKHESLDAKVSDQQKRTARRSQQRESVVLAEAKAKLQKSEQPVDGQGMKDKNDSSSLRESAILLEAKSKLQKRGKLELNAATSGSGSGGGGAPPLIRSSMLLEAKAKLNKTKPTSPDGETGVASSWSSGVENNTVTYRGKRAESNESGLTDTTRTTSAIHSQSKNVVAKTTEADADRDRVPAYVDAGESRRLSTDDGAEQIDVHGSVIADSGESSQATGMDDERRDETEIDQTSTSTLKNRKRETGVDVRDSSAITRSVETTEVIIAERQSHEPRLESKAPSPPPPSRKSAVVPDSVYSKKMSPNPETKSDIEKTPESETERSTTTDILDPSAVGFVTTDALCAKNNITHYRVNDSHPDVAFGAPDDPTPASQSADFTRYDGKERSSEATRTTKPVNGESEPRTAKLVNRTESADEAKPIKSLRELKKAGHSNDAAGFRNAIGDPGFISQSDIIGEEVSIFRGNRNIQEGKQSVIDENRDGMETNRGNIGRGKQAVAQITRNVVVEKKANNKHREGKRERGTQEEISLTNDYAENKKERRYDSRRESSTTSSDTDTPVPSRSESELYTEIPIRRISSKEMRKEIYLLNGPERRPARYAQFSDSGSAISCASSNVAPYSRGGNLHLVVNGSYADNYDVMYSPGSSSTQTDNTSISVPVISPSVSRGSSVSTTAQDTFEYSRVRARGRGRSPPPSAGGDAHVLRPLTINILSPEARGRKQSPGRHQQRHQPGETRSHSQSRSAAHLDYGRIGLAPSVYDERSMFRMSRLADGEQTAHNSHDVRGLHSAGSRRQPVQRSYNGPLSHGGVQLAGARHPHRMRPRDESFNSQSSGPLSPPGRYLRVDESRGGRVPIYGRRAMRATDFEGFAYSRVVDGSTHQRHPTPYVSQVHVEDIDDRADANSVISEPIYIAGSGKYPVQRMMEKSGLNGAPYVHTDVQYQSRKRRVYQSSGSAVDGHARTLNQGPAARMRSPEVTAVDPTLQEVDKKGDRYNVSLKLNAMGNRPASRHEELYEEQMNSLNSQTATRYGYREAAPLLLRSNSYGPYDGGRDLSPTDSTLRQMTLVKLKQPSTSSNDINMQGQYTTKARFKVKHDAPEVIVHGRSVSTEKEYVVRSTLGADGQYLSGAGMPSPGMLSPNRGSEAPRFTMTVNQTMTMDYVAPTDEEEDSGQSQQPAPPQRPPRKKKNRNQQGEHSSDWYQESYHSQGLLQTAATGAPPPDEHRKPRKRGRGKMNGHGAEDLENYLSPAEEKDDEQHIGNMPQVVRGSILIKNAIDTTGAPKVIDVVEGEDSDDDIVVEDNVNMFQGSYFQSRENPLYASDQDLSEIRDKEYRPPQFTKIFGTDDEQYTEIKVNRESGKKYKSRDKRSGFDETDIGYNDQWEETRRSRVYGDVPGQSKMSREQRTQYEISRLLKDAPQGSIKQTINVEREEEDIIGPLPVRHADGSGGKPEDMLNFDTVSEKVDLGLKEGKAEVTVKVRCERIVPIRGVEDMFKKSSVIVTRLIEIDLFATEERRRLWENIVRRTSQSAISDGRERRRYVANDAKLSTKDTFNLYKTFMGLAEADEAGKSSEYTRIDRQVDEERRPDLYAGTDGKIGDDELEMQGFDPEELDRKVEENLVNSYTSKKLEPDTMSYMSAASETHDMLY